MSEINKFNGPGIGFNEKKDSFVYNVFDISSIAGLGNNAKEVLSYSDENSMKILNAKVLGVLKNSGLYPQEWDNYKPGIEGVELGVGVGAEDYFEFVYLQAKDLDQNPQSIYLAGVAGLDTSGEESRNYYRLFLQMVLSEENAALLADSIRSGAWEKECGIKFEGLENENSKISQFLRTYNNDLNNDRAVSSVVGVYIKDLDSELFGNPISYSEFSQFAVPVDGSAEKEIADSKCLNSWEFIVTNGLDTQGSSFELKVLGNDSVDRAIFEPVTTDIPGLYHVTELSLIGTKEHEYFATVDGRKMVEALDIPSDKMINTSMAYYDKQGNLLSKNTYYDTEDFDYVDVSRSDIKYKDVCALDVSDVRDVLDRNGFKFRYVETAVDVSYYEICNKELYSSEDFPISDKENSGKFMAQAVCQLCYDKQCSEVLYDEFVELINRQKEKSKMEQINEKPYVDAVSRSEEFNKMRRSDGNDMLKDDVWSLESSGNVTVLVDMRFHPRGEVLEGLPGGNADVVKYENGTLCVTKWTKGLSYCTFTDPEGPVVPDKNAIDCDFGVVFEIHDFPENADVAAISKKIDDLFETKEAKENLHSLSSNVFSIKMYNDSFTNETEEVMDASHYFAESVDHICSEIVKSQEAAKSGSAELSAEVDFSETFEKRNNVKGKQETL